MTSKSNGDVSEWARAPPSGPAWRRCLTAIYNPEEKSFLGRTAKRWDEFWSGDCGVGSSGDYDLKVVGSGWMRRAEDREWGRSLAYVQQWTLKGIMFTFYAVFYAVLAVLFSLCMGGLLLSIDKERPTYTLEKSLIGNNPGLAFRPWPLDGFVVGYARDNFTLYAEHLDEFFEPYVGDRWLAAQTECVANTSYGYPDAPCFYVKLNRIYDWSPQLFDDASSLPADMPADLVDHIQRLDPAERKQVWISCAQEKGNFTRIEYPWGRGLPGSFYPFVKQKGYLGPLVAVRILAPANTPVTVRCRAWARNIVYNKSIKEPSGHTRIQLYIEDLHNTHAEVMV